jgi:hypothetical protein
MINLIARPLPGVRDSDVAQVAGALKAQYEKAGARVTRTDPIPLAGHEALRVAVQLPVTGAGGVHTSIKEVQDLLAANDFIYIVTFAGASSAFSTITSTLSV